MRPDAMQRCRSLAVPAARAVAGLALVAGVAFAAGLARPASAATREAAAPASEAERLDRLFEEYFEAYLAANPVFATFVGDHRYDDRYTVSIAPAERAQAEALDREYLARIVAIEPERLDADRRLSWRIFKSQRERALEALRFPSHLLPLNQFFSTPNSFAQLGSGAGLHPFKTVRDYENWLRRVDGFVAWTDQAIANMREGAAKGYVQPRILMEKTLPQLAAHVVERPEDSLFFGPLKALPETFSPADRDRLSAAFRAAISEKLVPAYRRLHDFVAGEYLPLCRETVGLQALPDGAAWYAFNVRSITTTALTPDEVHQIGLAEVERIHGEMDRVMREVAFAGDRAAFFRFLKEDPRFYWNSREELVAGYYAIKQRVDANLARLFETLPQADYEIRAVEPFREKSASGGQYQAASPDGSRPGIFYANAYDLKSRPKWAMESLSLHEGNPGHHFQGMVARENESLPRFRRFGGFTAYSEGWGLYAESLGRELGVYTDPYQYFGMLEAELWRAIRLVVDTGIHTKGWTRQQVLDYMGANSAAGEATKVSEAERFMAIPGQALAYKIGQMKIRELRVRAETRLGARFDVRRFHTQVLEAGALPLDVLEEKIDAWIAAEAAASAPGENEGETRTRAGEPGGR